MKVSANATLFHMNTNSFFMHIRTDDIYEDIANDVKKIVSLNYAIESPLSIGKKLKSNCTNESCIR